MSLRLLRRTFSKVAIIAGSLQSDAKGVQVMNAVRKVDPAVEFIGIGGAKMQKAGQDATISSDELPHKYFYPFANMYIDPRFVLSIFMIPENLRLAWPIIKLYQGKFWKNFETENRKDVDMVVTVDNQLLAFRIFELMELYFRDNAIIKPLRVHYGSTIRNYKWDYLRSIDYLIYDLPIKSIDNERFAYPSQYIGKQTVYDALKFILSSSVHHKASVGEHHIDVDQDSIFEMTRQFRLALRRSFRQKHGLPENSVLLFFAPGSAAKDISTNLKTIAQTLEVLKGKVHPDEVIMPIIYLPEQHPDVGPLINQYAGTFSMQFIYGHDKKARMEAMAACNFGAIEGDDLIFEAATLQLPTVVLDSTNYYTAYISLMHNVYSSEINRTVGGELFPEMTLWNFGSKLVEFWEEWMINPDARYTLAHRFSKHVLKMAPTDHDLKFPHKSAQNLPSNIVRLYEPDFVREEFLKHILVEFKKVKQSKMSLGEKQLKRKELILGPE